MLFRSRFGAAAGHQIAATFLIALFARQLTGVLGPVLYYFPNFSSLWGTLLRLPFFPFHVLLALLVGWLAGTPRRDKWMKWVWVLPACGFVLFALALPPSWGLPAFASKPDQTFWTRFFGRGCLPDQMCLEQLAATLPLLTSLAYCLAAWIGQRMQVMDKASRDLTVIAGVGMGILLLVPISVYLLEMVIPATREILRSIDVRDGIGPVESLSWGLLETGLPALYGAYMISVAGSSRRGSLRQQA